MKEQKKIQKVFISQEKDKKKNLCNFSWELDGLSLFCNNKLYFTQEDKDVLNSLIGANLVPWPFYKEIWLIGSGAKRQMDTYPDYYKNIIENYPYFIPSPYENQINLDLNRSYPGEAYFQVPANLTKLKNVLLAYSRRNVVVGYCQGFNFIVGKLLLVFDSEEICFWIFAQIIEEFLPPDYYTQIGGAQLDCDAITDLVSLRVGKYLNTDKLRNIILAWIISLFAQITNDNTLNLIWTAFFLNGMASIYSSASFFIYNLSTKVNMKGESVKLNSLLDKELKSFNEKDKLKEELFNQETAITLNAIENWRNANREPFYKESLESIDSSAYYTKNSILNIPQCDLDWPLCLYDRKYRFEIPLFTVFTCKDPPVFIDNFFFLDCGKETGKEAKYKTINDKLMNPIMKKASIYSDLIIERRKHHCASERHFTTDIYKIIKVDNKDLFEDELEKQFKLTKMASMYFDNSNQLFSNKGDKKIWEVVEKKNENKRYDGVSENGINNLPLSHSIYL